jgi:hypothetical protein
MHNRLCVQREQTDAQRRMHSEENKVKDPGLDQEQWTCTRHRSEPGKVVHGYTEFDINKACVDIARDGYYGELLSARKRGANLWTFGTIKWSN